MRDFFSKQLNLHQPANKLSKFDTPNEADVKKNWSYVPSMFYLFGYTEYFVL
jgi:hypothetical protein